jgi:hypothetical protein
MTGVRRLDERTKESRGERHDPESREDRQPAVKLTAIMAAGLAAAVAAFFTSRFGIAGTVLGTAATAMIITAGSAVISFLFEYAADRARVLPGTLQARPPRRPVLLGGLVAAAASFLVGMGAVTGVELSVDRSLSCWVWEECPAQSADRGAASDTTTRPSILGGGEWIADTSARPRGASQPPAPERQKAPDFPQVPRQQPGPLPESNSPKPPATPEWNAPVLGTPGKEAPGQTPGGTPSDGEAFPRQPNQPPGGSDRPSPTDEPPAEEPRSDQPVRPLPWVQQQRPG